MVTLECGVNVAFVVLASWAAHCIYPNAQLFDGSENAAFEFKFRAAQVVGVLGGAAGMLVCPLSRAFDAPRPAQLTRCNRTESESSGRAYASLLIAR
jgi:hypothetical protein